ncbi:hypothetical protein BMS3Bbin04_00882 [bacterium BMS3Bbin04]|nr:hypothetical protein BMS3Bbin04_00882 [bacterium BMS3Bbin04]
MGDMLIDDNQPTPRLGEDVGAVKLPDIQTLASFLEGR